MKKYLKSFLITLLCLHSFNTCFANTEESLYPDFSYIFLGEDKYENYNRKMFNFNQGLNKYVIRPLNVIWASVMPQYGMDRIYGISNNIEFPIRFVSCLVQRDFKAAFHESERFIINSTIGIAGMFDPAKHILKIEQVNEDMEQALAKCHVKSKRFFVFPFIYFTTYRGLAGKVLDAALNPTTYVGSPIIAAIKAGLTINRVSFAQAMLKALEINFPDAYDVYKTLYGVDRYSKQNNLDRVDVISQLTTEKPVKTRKRIKKKIRQADLKVSASISNEASYEDNATRYKYEEIVIDTIITQPKTNKKPVKKEKLNVEPNILLDNYNAQNPFTDSMRTTLFYIPETDKSIWNELSIWNRSFKNRIKASNINLAEGRENYTYRYILQKEKNAPLAVVYPSTGAGVFSNHPIMFAKIFYDLGYSVLIIGNPFQWEFMKSMPEDYRPGLPENDAKMVRMATGKIINHLEKKYKREFKNKVILGTSYGAMTSLFMANQEYKENTLGNAEFIAINPPVDLFYSVNLLDDVYKNLNMQPDELKDMMADIAAKTIKLYKSKKEIDFTVNNLPYSEKESKFLTSFLMHHKLADVIFVIENTPNNKKSGIYEITNDMGYKEYSEKYLLVNTNSENKKMLNNSKLTYISNYLKNGKNYKIYHSSNDYLVSKAQLKQLKQMTGDNLILIDNGSHLGFLYRSEFMEDLKNTIIEIKSKNMNVVDEKL